MPEAAIAKGEYSILILGAGASYAFRSPLMNEFMHRARRYYFDEIKINGLKRLQEAYEELFAFQVECQRSSFNVNRNWENIEEVYTQADLLRLAQYPTAKDSQRKCDNIAWVIWDVYRRTYAATSSISLGQVFSDLSSLYDMAQPVILTTNYDLNLEADFIWRESQNTKPWSFYYPGFVSPCWKSIPSESIKQNLPNLSSEVGDFDALMGHTDNLAANSLSVPIIKLHGSANWFDLRDGETEHTLASLKISDPSECERATSCINSIPLDVSDISRLLRRNKDEVVRPTIIPPMLGKASTSLAIARQWQAAIQFLKRARAIYVIGYSFPETDAFITRLLAAGLQDNFDLEAIRIVNIEPESDWQDRIRRIFSPIVKDTKVRYTQLDDAWKLSEELRTQAKAHLKRIGRH